MVDIEARRPPSPKFTTAAPLGSLAPIDLAVFAWLLYDSHNDQVEVLLAGPSGPEARLVVRFDNPAFWLPQPGPVGSVLPRVGKAAIGLLAVAAGASGVWLVAELTIAPRPVTTIGTRLAAVLILGFPAVAALVIGVRLLMAAATGRRRTIIGGHGILAFGVLYTIVPIIAVVGGVAKWYTLVFAVLFGLAAIQEGLRRIDADR